MKRIIIQITLLLFGAYLHAQQPFSNTGNLQIHSGGSLTGFGNFTNASTGGLVNNGNFYVRGNLTNSQSSMTIGTGTLYLNGTVAQSVDGTQPFRTFNLVSDNTSTGITLNNNLSVTGTHTYTNGIIISSSTPNYLIYEAGSSYSGDADTRHVNGWVKKIGSTNFAFPVGNGTVIRKASIETLSASLEFNAKYEAPTNNTSNVQSPLVLVDPNEYWVINRVDASGSAQVHLNWDDAKVSFPQYDITAIRTGYYTGGLWTNVGGSASGNVNTTGDITSNTVSAFGNFTFASTSFLLPLQFLGITAQHKTGYNLIEWRTASATNTDHFEIERSENAIHFQKIGSTASYNSLSAMTYTFKDVNLLPETLWYRIRSVDKDGSSKLSTVVSLTDAPQTNQSMYVLNNPARGSIHLFAPNTYKGECDYFITNTNGQLMQRGTLMINNAGNVFIKLNAGISEGVYILNVKNGSQHFKERILVRQ